MGIIGLDGFTDTKKEKNDMKVTAQAIIYSFGSFHSQKTNKDYNTVGLIVEGVPKTFFLSQDVANSFLVMPVVKKFLDGGKQPVVCKAMFNVIFRERDVVVNVEDLAA